MIAATLLGAAAGGDRTAFGQTFLAHPLVGASLAGWLAGAPAEGVWMGTALSIWSAPRLPVGEARLRDWTSAAVAGPFLVPSEAREALWGASLLATLLVALVGGRLIEVVRGIAARGDQAVDRSVGDGDLGRLQAVHLVLTALHFARGGVVVLAAVLLGRLLLGTLPGRLGEPEVLILTWTWRLAPAAGLPILLRFHARGARPQWLAAGIGAGLLAAWLLGR